MTAKERRTIIFAVMLILIAVGLSECGGDFCSAETTTATPTVTETDRYSTISGAEKFTLNDEALGVAWPILREAGYSEVAAAAILGNLQYESVMQPYRIESYSSAESAKLNAIYKESRYKFVNSWHGYGLASWTGYTNHCRLWDWMEEHDYEIDSLEGQIRFLIDDYPYMAENSFKRMQYYDIDDIVTATEDFRQSYEKSELSERSQYSRAKFAKLIYATYCEDIYTIEQVSKAPMNFDIYMKVKEMNKKIAADAET